MIRIVSFGYGHAAPPAAEATYDLRKLFYNPFHDPELKNLTGLDTAVYGHVLATRGTESLAQVVTFLAVGLHDTARGGDITIAYGCVGGRHRSVAMARRTQVLIQLTGRETAIEHRDVGKPLLPPRLHAR
ncbi:RNase adapter RapZ [Streptomyces scabiei]|uniref:RapZ C-terminal domain-containing protein n=1 Tax=Streptomyces scabiei TaxID=1930 RepID=UPI0029906C0C|nr:RNase adapter RapZ [Streptomyces scabiei]MDW8803659.1 RNase adapter RapZ [Streptomyces scabiei]